MNQARRHYYLDAIGIQNWQLKTAEATCYTEQDAVEQTIVEMPKITQEVPRDVEPEVIAPEVMAPESSAEEIIAPITNTPESKVLTSVSKTPEKQVISFAAPASELEQSLKECKQCTSRQSRLSVLTGLGTIDAKVFVISEAPSAEEDRSGHYLNEQKGSLLQAMFQCIDVQESFFLTGIIKCYSATDYLYSEEEVAHCSQYLHAQIEQVKPQVIMVWGAAQAQSLLQSKKSFNELRGQVHRLSINEQEYSLVVSYHPAYLLRNPLYKREALNDLIMLKQLLND
ncbi:uracil-DNA glycosylase [sulfur-oxidizing endosymbiont of Gigantopelta aegis]|uniref:uracil-DNA glycosylase n=1 Tax=sulfur-oxidizing endosymbiont of Gigantopelta aegis TaxID=2794934 RepID=UPI0018DD9D6C|nr:uracil-DNA glycosylase [sulfur-oxidizing endosymbiont of Gigantopelta aegis]